MSQFAWTLRRAGGGAGVKLVPDPEGGPHQGHGTGCGTHVKCAPALKQQRAFTLIEVIVALFIVALGLGALLSTLTSSAGNIEHLRDKSFAEWVALNRISSVRLARPFPTTGKTNGQEDFANTKWYWRQEVTDTGNARACSALKCQCTHRGDDAPVAGNWPWDSFGCPVSDPSGMTRTGAWMRCPCPAAVAKIHRPAPCSVRSRNDAPATRIHPDRDRDRGDDHGHPVHHGLWRHHQAVGNRGRLQENSARLRAVQFAVRSMVQDFSQLTPRPVREPIGDGSQPPCQRAPPTCRRCP